MNFADSFLPFLIRAKKETYASQGDDAAVFPILEGSRQLEYREGEYLYRDIYFEVKGMRMPPLSTKLDSHI